MALRLILQPDARFEALAPHEQGEALHRACCELERLHSRTIQKGTTTGTDPRIDALDALEGILAASYWKRAKALRDCFAEIASKGKQ